MVKFWVERTVTSRVVERADGKAWHKPYRIRITLKMQLETNRKVVFTFGRPFVIAERLNPPADVRRLTKNTSIAACQPRFLYSERDSHFLRSWTV
jgi:hypothetical protein